MRDLQNPYLYTAQFNEMFRLLSRAGWLEIERSTGEWRLRPCDYSLVRQVDLEHLHGGRVQLGRRGLTATDIAPLIVPIEAGNSRNLPIMLRAGISPQ